MSNLTGDTIRKILASIACEVGQLDGTIAMLQEQRDAAERQEVRKEIHVSLLDEMSRRDGLRRALRIAADVAEIDAIELARIAADVGARKLTDDLQLERELTNCHRYS